MIKTLSRLTWAALISFGLSSTGMVAQTANPAFGAATGVITQQAADTEAMMALHSAIGDHLIDPSTRDAMILEAAIAILTRAPAAETEEAAAEPIEEGVEAAEVREVLTEATPADPTDIAVQALRDAIGETDAPSHVAFLTAQLRAAVAAHGTGDALPEATRGALLLLGEEIHGLSDDRPVLYAGDLANRLTTTLTAIGADPALQNVQQTLVLDLNALRSALLTLETPYFHTALQRRTTDLTTTLGNQGDAQLRSDDIAALEALQGAIHTALEQSSVRRIHVVSARFGRVSRPGMGESCTMTHAVRSQCQGETHCTIPVDDIEAACGGSTFAAGAQGHQRGVVVQYACLPGNPSQWEASMASTNSQFSGETLTGIFRTNAFDLRCSTIGR